MIVYLRYYRRVFFYYVKQIVFLLYRFVVFLTKPGALIVFPVLIIGAGYFFSDKINSHPFAVRENIRVYNDLAEVIYAATGYQDTFAVIGNRTPAETVMGLGVISIAFLWLLALLLRPIIGAFPIITPPMKPRLLVPPKPVELKAYPVSVVAPKLPPAAWNGGDKEIIAVLAPRLQEILKRDHEAINRQLEREIVSQPIPNETAPEPEDIATSHDDDIVRPR